MKNRFVLPLFMAALSLASCGGSSKPEGSENDSTATENSTELDLTGMTEFNMKDAGLNTTLMVAEEIGPNGAPFPIKDSVIIEGISWQVRVGDKFDIVLEEADGSGKYIETEKKRLEETGIYDLKYEVDKPNAILYEANLKGGAGSKPFYHVFGIVKIEGKDFIIKSSDAGEFNKGQAEKMLKTILALQKEA